MNQILPWEIRRVSPIDSFSETIFCIGNGRLGVRGFGAWERKVNPQEHAIFCAGLFSQIKSGITDMVQLPDLLTLRPVGEAPRQLAQSLNLRDGVLTQSWDGDRAAYRMERAASMARETLLLQRLCVTAKQDGEFVVEAIEDAAVANLPVHDDQTIQAKEQVVLLAQDELSADCLRLHTIAEHRPVAFRWTLTCDVPCARSPRVEETCAVTAVRLSLRAGETATLEKRVWMNDADAPTADDPWRESAERWHALWRDCDIELDADDPEMQGALRYNIFQLLCSNAARDRGVSIGARGLTHGRYKGNAFWDTDIFLLPFYLWTRPEAARNLLLYRIDRLPAAMALAKKQNLEGARYPWMCASDGAEQCESWDIGLCEVHITADVAYAMQRYGEVSGDERLLRGEGRELLLQTARYWRSRLTYEPDKDQYSSFFVKGPDEYCGAAINNTYTNYMARNNLRLALRYGAPDENEARETRRVAEKIALLYDGKRGLYLQDETLERLPPLPPKADTLPSYKSVCFDRMQRYRALKQADLVLLMTLFPRDFTPDQQRAVFDAYEPLTVHDSTLSYGAHALLALRLGKWEKAEDYLEKSVYLDLRNTLGNTGEEGVHMAALGAAWQAFVFGAAGLWAEDGQLTLEPQLPPSLHGMRFHIRYHGKRYAVRIHANEYDIGEEA